MSLKSEEKIPKRLVNTLSVDAVPVARHADSFMTNHRFPVRREPETCRFFARGYCYRGNGCKFNHEQPHAQEWLAKPQRERIVEHWTREIGGAWTDFGDGATVKNVSLPSDYSAIRIRKLPGNASSEFVRRLLADVGITVLMSDINFIKPENMSSGTAIVKVKDPAFAKSACAKLSTCIQAPDLDITMIPVPMPPGSSFGLIDSKNVRCSWHRPTRTVCLYFSDQVPAVNSFNKFRGRGLKICGLSVKPQAPSLEDGQWKMDLEGIVATITREDISNAFSSSGAPCQIEMREPSYEMDMDIDSTMIKSLLYEVGALERWDVFGSPKARRIKAQARFVQEADAFDAVSQLNDTELPFNSAGKLFLQPLLSVKFKVSTRVYEAVNYIIEFYRTPWERQFIHLSALPEHGYHRVLKPDIGAIKIV
ncbi:hypothetical protein F53441_278 [Fusarium austroafricanum]|uniref:C3H1-type domain-containing protein n=1 Tax=Fusarium austroafricanum TaxID=2364996 RepID=A0A8H4KXI9_9HYPO|nr:hypothetical protein F53441_278 [Fusarium austroafricanum]